MHSKSVQLDMKAFARLEVKLEVDLPLQATIYEQENWQHNHWKQSPIKKTPA